MVFPWFVSTFYLSSRFQPSGALTDIAKQSELSKRGVQDALSWLVKRKLLTAERASITAIPVYTVLRPWVRGHP